MARGARLSPPFIFLLIVAVAFLIYFLLRPHAPPQEQVNIQQPATSSGLPEMAIKPTPKEIDFQGCPPEGDGGDPALNRLKNRIDDGEYIPVEFDAVAKLTWPQSVERKKRQNWSDGDTKSVARYEGIPISVSGYLAGAKEEGPESPNCHGADHDFRDYHIWLVKSADDGRDKSIVVEVTPRIRVNHPAWNLAALRKIAKEKDRVRISGWLMLDPEHPDQVGKTRGTIWEIHPIMKIEVDQNGGWVTLDAIGS